MAKRLSILVGVLLLFSAVAGIVLCEGGIAVPPQFRVAASTELASAFASQTGATWRPVEITAADGITLKAWLFQPHQPNGKGAILLHGVVDTRRGTLGDARILLRQGYTVLTPDSRAHGESGGAIMSYGLREVDDVRRWADWLAQQQGVRELYALGHSMGASILLQAIGAGVPIRALVADCPFVTFHDVAYDRIGGILGIRPFSRLLLWPAVEPAFLYARLRHGLNLYRASPLDGIRSAKVPVLLIHGLEDVNIPVDHSRQLQAANTRLAQLWEVPRAAHVSAIATEPAEYERRVLAWFNGK
ncbi:MAG: alpha/beta fold hydrolase [Bryobacteraceae bacterium]